VIAPRGAIEAVKLGQFAQRSIDLPQQHGGACRRAAAARIFTVNQYDLMSVAGEAFGDQGARYACPDNQGFAAKAFGDLINPARRRCRIPRRPRRPQVGVIYIVTVRNGDGGLASAGGVERPFRRRKVPGACPPHGAAAGLRLEH